MSAVDAKPVVPTEAGAVEPTPTPAAPVVEADKPTEAVEALKTEEPAPAKAEGESAAATEEKKEEKAEEKKEEKVVEPITSGVLGYKAPGLKNAFRFSKRFFWFGEEAVPTSSLSQYLRGEKAEVAHPVAAWSSQTGKGLLYFVKHQDQKETPAGVLNLSDATDLHKDGTLAFAFKIHGHKHTFEAQSAPERNGWFVAAEKAIEEAKAAKEGIVSSDSYKEQLEKLGKPTTLAATPAKESTPKKSTDVTPKPAETEAGPAAAAEETAPTARAGSSSSSSSDEDKKKKKAKSKSRSVSRGKRSSIFGGFLGKKEKAEEKAEEKKEESEAKEETPAPAAAEASTTAPVITQDIPKPSEELKTEEPAIVAPATEEKKEEEEKVEEKPKPAKRGSIFGSFVKGLKSPTHEKKEHEVTPAPAVPAKEAETTAEAPKVEETPAVAPATDATPAAAEAPKAEEAKKSEETKPATTTPHKEKSSFSFGKFLGGAKEKVKSPTGEKAPEAPKTEEPAKAEETPAVAPVEPVAEAPKEEKKEETPAEAPKEEEKKKRGSIFGSLIRNASKAGKSKKEKEATNPPAKVEETAEPKEEEAKTETPAAVAAPEEKKEETPAAAPSAIGDVVPDAVTVGQATKSTPPVATTA